MADLTATLLQGVSPLLPLHEAALANHCNFIMLLRSHSADIDAVNSDVSNPFCL